MALDRPVIIDDDGTNTTGTEGDAAWVDDFCDRIDSAIDGADATTRPVNKGGTGAATFTDGGVLVGNGTGAIQATAVGTAGHVLTSNGAGSDPTFQAPAAAVAGADKEVQFNDGGAAGAEAGFEYNKTTNTLTVPNVNVTGLIGSSGQFRCKAYKSAANQSIPDSVFTAVTLDAEAFDVGAMHDNATNNSRITIPSGGDGLYEIVATVTFAANATGTRNISLKKNGTTYFASVQFTGVNITQTNQCIAYASLVAGDYVEVEVFQSSGGALNVNLSESSTSLILVKSW